jgi:GTP-dependent phosphoenolpyruvate carboxykinase
MNSSETQSKKILSGTSVIWFGKKYKGRTVNEVLAENPSYLSWALKEIKDISFTPDVLAKMGDIQIPAFNISPKELTEHAMALDDYVKNWVISPKIVPHLRYFTKLAADMNAEFLAKNSLYIKL